MNEDTIKLRQVSISESEMMENITMTGIVLQYNRKAIKHFDEVAQFQFPVTISLFFMDSNGTRQKTKMTQSKNF